MQIINSLILPSAWLAVVALSFYGWGTIIARHCFKGLNVGQGLTIAFGFGTFLYFSGWLEFTRAADRIVFFAFIVLGLVIAANRAIRADLNKDSIRRFLIFGSVSSGVFLGLWLIFVSWEFNYHDDFQGYLIFPLRIFAEGFQGADFLNDRRIASGGAGSYLNALFLTVLPIEFIRIADLGMGFVLMVMLVLEHSKRRFVALLSGIFLVIYTPFANISTTYTGAAMAYGLFLFSFKNLDLRSDRRSFGWGLFAGVMASLKANFTFPVAIAGAVDLLGAAYQSRSMKVLRFIPVALAGVVVILLPWSMVNFKLFGTAYFPFLGSGYTQTGTASWNQMHLIVKYTLEILPFFVISASVAALIFVAQKRSNRNERIYLLLLSAVSIVVSFIFCLTPAGGARYAFSSSAIPCLFLLVEATNGAWAWSLKSIKDSLYRKTVLALLALSVGWGIYDINRQHFHAQMMGERLQTSYELLTSGKSTSAQVFHTVDIEEQRKRMAKLQGSIPAGEKLVARMDLPFLFDYSRQFISAPDVPGCTGPDGGMPYSEPEKIAAYFRKQGFKYFAYSYKNEALHPRGMCEMRLRDEWAFARSLAFRICSFQEQIKPLFSTYKVVYADEYDALVNLCELASGGAVNDPLCVR